MHFIKERIQVICDELNRLTYHDEVMIDKYEMVEGHYLTADELPGDGWQSFQTGDLWGERDLNAWFKSSVTVPLVHSGRTIALHFQTFEQGWDATNPQFILFVDGQHLQGLDMNHREVILTHEAEAGKTYQIDLHAYAGMSGMPQEYRSTLTGKLVVIDDETRGLYFDLQTPLWVCEKLDEEDERRIDMLRVLNEAVNLIDLRKPYSHEYYQSIEAARRYLAENFYGQLCGHDDIRATVVGHTHIDVAWHWTVAQTRQKAGRSFSTVLRLMEEYPEYMFMSSQPQLYQFIKEDYPELYEKIKIAVADGRWEAEGAMWLEADCNVTSGESLVRQILYGKQFFKREFSVDNKVLWLPDVFGYSAALPQILKKSGIPYFMTTKIAWNQFNKIPYDTFMWKGIDGTEVLTHFITTTDPYQDPNSHFTTYNGNLHPGAVMGAWRRYQQKEINKDVLISYGHGDGGGGVTMEMLEAGRRMEKGIPGCPKVVQGHVRPYFERLEQQVADKQRLPKWSGELYLEYHRGTYTSMARNKRDNRKSELLYTELEKWHSIAKSFGSDYPKDTIDKHWRTILLNQFHDILPGSSIKEVYDVTAEEYAEVLADGEALRQQAFDAIATQISTPQKTAVVFNAQAHKRSDIVSLQIQSEIQNPIFQDQEGKAYVGQVVGEKQAIFYAEDLPATGYKTFHVSDSKHTLAGDELQISVDKLENRYFVIRLDDKGQFTSCFDKVANREVFKAGEKANVLQAFEDKPMYYDNWDIDIFYSEKMWLVDDVQKIEVVATGPVRATLAIHRRFVDSIIVQHIHIYKDIPRVDFETYVDWQQSQVLLKAAFPVDINSNKATYEIQYGNVERPTHMNTSWDTARFEVCAHKWVDLSEAGYGVSLMNDSKYGHDIIDGNMRITLLKSGIVPNPVTDREEHWFTYSFYPHSGTWREAATEQLAANLNSPLQAMWLEPQAGKLPADVYSFVAVDAKNVHIETIKIAEDGHGIIVRLYESHNTRTSCKIEFFREPARVTECMLTEEELAPIETFDNTIDLEMHPYEIKTLRIVW